MKKPKSKLAREDTVWLGDVVRLGGGCTEWTVIRGDRDAVHLRSPKGVERRAVRERVTLIRRCPDGPQLEDWSDGRAYFGEHLVLASECLQEVVTWWREEGTRGSSPHGVSMRVCDPGAHDNGRRVLELSTFGYWQGTSLLRREEAVALAEQLLRIARHL